MLIKKPILYKHFTETRAEFRAAYPQLSSLYEIINIIFPQSPSRISVQLRALAFSTNYAYTQVNMRLIIHAYGSIQLSAVQSSNIIHNRLVALSSLMQTNLTSSYTSSTNNVRIKMLFSWLCTWATLCIGSFMLSSPYISMC